MRNRISDSFTRIFEVQFTKIDVVVDFLSTSCGDSKEIVLDTLAQIIIDKCYTTNDIKRIVAPMLSKA